MVLTKVKNMKTIVRISFFYFIFSHIFLTLDNCVGFVLNYPVKTPICPKEGDGD